MEKSAHAPLSCRAWKRQFCRCSADKRRVIRWMLDTATPAPLRSYGGQVRGWPGLNMFNGLNEFNEGRRICEASYWKQHLLRWRAWLVAWMGSVRCRVCEWGELYRLFTDLTGLEHAEIKFLGFDWVRMGSGAALDGGQDEQDEQDGMDGWCLGKPPPHNSK